MTNQEKKKMFRSFFSGCIQINHSLEGAFEEAKSICLRLKIGIEEIEEELREEIFSEIIPEEIIQEPSIKPWLQENSDKINWGNRDRYMRYMTSKKGFKYNAMVSVDRTTNKILDLIGCPRIHSSFDVKGMVMGYVQSGKTTNYIALINKAVDCGYKIIIVLTGMQNSLRNQTQIRVDEMILGVDTAIQKKIGVGTMSDPVAPIQYLTNRGEDGDFKKSRASAKIRHFGEIPHIFVVKKEGSVLRNLSEYFQAVQKTLNLKNLPLLMIDDEADQASVNTNDPDKDPTTINRRINEILNLFSAKSYIGYTATPYANVFIKQQEDIFPKDFIVVMNKPEGYRGAEEVLGLKEYRKYYRYVSTHEDMIPEDYKNDKDYIPEELNEDLKNSIYAFLTVICIRELRGQHNIHNSMMIHASRLKNVQSGIRNLVEDFLSDVEASVRYGGDSCEMCRAIKKVYIDEYGDFFSWIEIFEVLKKKIGTVTVKELNGNSNDILEYYENPKGINVIALGGNKFSRGLTLEGLSISYFMRPSKAYDSLMQMARWFGYRPGYEDLCRIYTSPDILIRFQNIFEAEKELREHLIEMRNSSSKPKDVGIMIRSFPGMLVTARNKMRNSRKGIIGYSGHTSETTSFNLDHTAFNLELTSNFVKKICSKLETGDGDCYFTGIKPAEIIGYLEKYRTNEEASRANTVYMAGYLKKALEEGSYKNWTVVLKNIRKNSDREGLKAELGGIGVGVSERSLRESVSYDRVINIGSLITGEDRFIGLSDEQKEKIENEKIKSTVYRKWRKKENGYLLIYPLKLKDAPEYDDRVIIGIGVVFGFNPDEKIGTEYVLNQVCFTDEGAEE